MVTSGGRVTMRFGVLGAVEAWRGGETVDVGHARQRRVLAALLVDAGRVVPAGALVERVWGERAPRRGRETLYGYVSRLRQALTPGGPAIARERGGYRIVVEPGAVDLHRFRELTGRARSAEADERAVALWEEALGLWRGEAFAGADTPWFEARRDVVEEERLAAQADLVDARLRLGQHALVLAECAARARAHPLDERMAGQLMLALYGCGRQAEALECYDRTRRALAEEMGVDPGAPLRRIHHRILTADPALDVGRHAPARGAPPTAPGGAPGAATAGRGHLPRDLGDFTGRAAEVARLVASAGDTAVVHTVDGMAGVGKTSLAVHVAHLLADRYPDGRLFVDLRGHSVDKPPLLPDEALEVLLGQLGIAAPGDAAARWRAETTSRRLLVVLDNAVDETQVVPLLPAGPALTIVTSRTRLLAVDAARPLSLKVLPDEEATALLTRVVGAARAAAEPDAVAGIVRLCAGLPLALRLAGAQLAHRATWPVAHLAARLAGARQRLPSLFADREVALAFDTSYEQLSPDDRRVFAALGRHPGPDADAAVIAAMTGTPVARADDALQRLVDAHLAEEAAVGRYRQHDLLRQYARGLPEDPRMVERMLGHYLSSVADATARLDTDDAREADAARAWLTVERSNLLAATRCAAAEGHGDRAWRLAVALWRLMVRSPAGDSLELLEQGLAAARESADGGEAVLNTLLALAHWLAGHVPLAHDLLAATKPGESAELRAHTVALLGLISLHRGAPAAAEEHAEQAFAELTGLDALSPLGLDARVMTHWTRGVVRGLRGDHEEALSSLRAAHESCEGLGVFSPHDHVLVALARSLVALGHPAEAVDHLERARDLRRRIGDLEGEAETLVLTGVARRAQGRAEEALRAQRSAVRMLRDDTRLQAYARIELGRTLAGLGHGIEAVEQYALALALAVRDHHLREEAQARHELARVSSTGEPTGPEPHRPPATIYDASQLPGARQRASLPHIRPAGW